MIPITCSVYADGVRLADGSEDLWDRFALYDPVDPTVLAELHVTWGRESTVDQPEDSVCSFEVMDRAGGQVLAALLHAGSQIDVVATGRSYPDPTEPTFPDPGFDTGVATTISFNAAAVVVAGAGADGGHALRLTPTAAATRMTAVIAPAPFVPAGTQPGAWDHLPATSPGQTWSVGARVRIPAGAAAQIRPVLWSGPWAVSGHTVSGYAVDVPGDGDWHDVAVTLPVTLSGRWVGLEVTVHPAGRSWVDLDPELTWLDEPGTWLDQATTWVDEVHVLGPLDGSGIDHQVLVFSGRVTGQETSWHDGLGCAVTAVTAVDFTADLENIRVGDEPWLVEPAGTRIQRILALTGRAVPVEMDATAAAIPVSWRDVDSQGAIGLLRELASSVDAVLWSATHRVTGPYLRLEDPAQRPALLALTAGTDGVVRIDVAPAGVGLDLPSDWILRDEVGFRQDVTDLITRAAIGWLEQGVDEDGLPATTERTTTVVDEPLEKRFGQRGFSLSSQLISAQDAHEVAERVLARTSSTAWRARGLVVADRVIDVITPADLARATDLLLALMDGTARTGQPLRITDLPAWAPAGPVAGCYLEGGTITHAAGRWELSLAVSTTAGLGQSAAWADLDPTWTWLDLDPAIAWDDLRGVTVTGSTP